MLYCDRVISGNSYMETRVADQGFSLGVDEFLRVIFSYDRYELYWSDP